MAKPFRLRDRYDNKWCIKYKIPDGTYRREVVSHDLKEAEKRLREIEVDIERGVWIDPRKSKSKQISGPQTWGEIVDMFKKLHYLDKDQGKSRECLQYMVNMLDIGRENSGPLLPLTTHISDITSEKMQSVYDSLTVYSLSRATKNMVVTYVKMVFKWAHKHTSVALTENHTEDWKRFRKTGSRGGTSTTRALEDNEVWTLSEVQAMIAYAREHRGKCNAALIETAFGTGLRKGELFGLQWQDVGFDTGMIHVRRNYARRPKSGESRVVPLEPSLGHTLQTWKMESPYSSPGSLVFPGANGEMRQEGYHWAALVRDVAKGAGTLRSEHRRYGHLTRHTFATLYLRAGGSDVLLAKMLGHRDTTLVHQVYSHFCASDLSDDMRRCGFSLGTPSGTHGGTHGSDNVRSLLTTRAIPSV